MFCLLSRNGKIVSRDFTYVDDVISGIRAAMDYDPVACGEIFNLGRGRPVSLEKMVAILEKQLNVSATKVSRLTAQALVIEGQLTTTFDVLQIHFSTACTCSTCVRLAYQF